MIYVLEQICAYIHNYFVHGVIQGTFTISDGTLDIPGIVEGQYIYISGSRMNDGVYTYPVTGLTDETFTGEIWDMRPPRAFMTLVDDIANWQTQYGAAVSSPYQSESFGGYSYSLKSGTTASGQQDNSASGWQGVFRTRLNQWRKIG